MINKITFTKYNTLVKVGKIFDYQYNISTLYVNLLNKIPI